MEDDDYYEQEQPMALGDDSDTEIAAAPQRTESPPPLKSQRRSGRSRTQTAAATTYMSDEESEEEEGSDDFEDGPRPAKSRNQDQDEDYATIPRGKEIEAILHVSVKLKSKWKEIMQEINSSKVRNGTRFYDEGEDVKMKEDEEEDMEEERFLIKWKDASRLHCSWETAHDLCNKLTVLHVSSRIEPRLRKARSQPLGHYSQEGGFNPELKRVERVLGVEPDRLYCKWAIIGYDEATWELISDLELGKVNYQPALDFYHVCKQREAEIAAMSMSQLNARLNERMVLPRLTESPLYGKRGNKLRPYQIEALNWLCFNWMQKRSSILADEMGLGKTACSVAFSNAVCKGRGPVLVVAPLPVLPHFAREFAAWTDLNVVVLRGNPKARAICKELEFYPSTGHKKWFKFDVLLTNYETVLEEEAALTASPWGLVVVDEGHRLKNRNSKLTQLLRDRMDKRSVLLLTGTPIQNDTTELWTLLNFIDPLKFNSLDDFVKKYGAMKTASQMDEFHTMLKPYLLRRFKTDVEANLPPKEEIVIEVELTELQKYYYRSVYEQNVQTLLRGVVAGTRLNLNNVAMQLRKVCNHPYLIEGVEAKSLADRGIAANIMMDKHAMTTLIEASGKFILLDKLLPKLKEQNHRVLIFSQFVRVLDILEDYCRFREYGYERIDGSVNGMRRQEAIDRYSDPESKSFVFLLSTRGCGQGINLTAADTVVLFDNDWNPQNDVQAQARCHRIGQTKPVSIYRMITRKTYEQEMFNRASLKLGLDEAMTSKLKDQQMEASSAVDTDETKLGAGVSDAELEHMLKYGAYALMKEDTTEASRAFCEADIDSILETRATRITSNGKQSDSSSTSKFSKATFVSNSAGEVTEMDDPQFWSKILGKDVATLNQEHDDGMGKGRRRRRVNYDENAQLQQAAAAAAAAAAGGDFDDSNDDDDGSPTAATPVRINTLSMTSAKNLITGLTTYAFGRYGEIAKKVGVQMKEEDCARYGLGIALVSCVWRSQEDRSGGFPFPISDSEEDVTNACKSLAGILTREPPSPLLENYQGPLRKSLLHRMARELKLHSFEVTKSMMLLSRLKERCKDTVGQLADVVDVDNYCTGETNQIGTFVRGVPPALAWVGQDDKALLFSFHKFGFERRRKAESWKAVFDDMSCGWTKHWNLPANMGSENDHEGGGGGGGGGEEVAEPSAVPTEPVADDVLSMKRLSSRLNRIIASLTEPVSEKQAAADASNANTTGTAAPVERTFNSTVMSEATRQRKKQEAEKGDIQAEWNPTEKERLTQLIMRWGVPDPSTMDHGMILDLGAPPTWDCFQEMLPRKTLESIQDRVGEMMTSFREMSDAGNCPPSKKGLLNRADLLSGMWDHLINDYNEREDFEEMLGYHFKGVQRHQKQMPAWWTPSLDIALLRAVCKYGVGAWLEALLDEDIFPQNLDPTWPAYPTVKDLNSRFVAVVDWLLLNGKKALPVDCSKFRERGALMLSPPTRQSMEDQMKKYAAALARNAKKGSKSKAKSTNGKKSKKSTTTTTEAKELDDDPVDEDDEEEDEDDAFEDEC